MLIVRLLATATESAPCPGQHTIERTQHQLLKAWLVQRHVSQKLNCVQGAASAPAQSVNLPSWWLQGTSAKVAKACQSLPCSFYSAACAASASLPPKFALRLLSSRSCVVPHLILSGVLPLSEAFYTSGASERAQHGGHRARRGQGVQLGVCATALGAGLRMPLCGLV